MTNDNDANVQGNTELKRQPLSVLQWLMIGGSFNQPPPTWEQLLRMSKARNSKSKASKAASDNDAGGQPSGE